MRSTPVARWSTAVALAAAAFVGVAPTAAAQTSTDPSPPPVTDYANYPLGLGIIPDGCTSEGASALVNPRFSVDGGPEVTDLQQLNLLPPAQQVVMTWDGFAPGCKGIGVGLSGKISGGVVFDPSEDQALDRTAYCGPDGIPCDEPHQLTLFLTEAASGVPDVACFQIDAHLGPALEVVGPSGAYYRLNQPFDMLVSAWNGGREPCDVPVTTLAPPTTQAPATTAAPTTAAPTTSASPTSATAAAAASSTTCAAGQVMGASGCVSVAGATATIPRTGAPSSSATGAAGIMLILAGSALVVGAGTMARHRRQA